ncbi:uncharacterized protein IWZ02DRAFT_286980 [Phyllosticta citriasiana]|uniref:Uncharacterized protein n=1 Tax=Phyllosticta citriasiana TaxID=595635 RepID=A0ABR1KXZ8_9PEZI
MPLHHQQITDASGQLQYVPFPVCNETGKPLELSFGVEQDLNCTIDFISDPLFHLLEFYVHNDAPLTCRVPSHPLPGSIISRPDPSSSDRKLNRNAHRNRNKNEATEADADEYSVDALSSTDAGALGSQSTAYTPLVIALTGTLQLSHLHVASTLNVLLHTSSSSSSSKKKKKKKTSKKAPASSILAATAYSASADDTSASDSTHSRIVIGDALPLRLRVRWYDGPSPPFGALSSSSTPFSVGGGGCSARAVLFYCALSAGAAVAVSFAWWRGVEMPRRLVRGVAGGGYGYGYGYGVGKEARLEGGLGENGNGARAYNGYGYSGLGLGLGNAGGGGGGGVGSGGKRD